MRITETCVNCILHQIDKAVEHVGCHEALAKEIRADAKRMSKAFDFEHSPPRVAKDVYQMLARKTAIKDPLRDLKDESIKAAKQLLPIITSHLESSDDPLYTALKASVAGNVIDFATEHTFDLKEEIETVFDTPFAANDYDAFKARIKSVDTLLILGDNSGENVFDRVLIETLGKHYPELKVFYAVRGEPIINDQTLREAQLAGVHEVCEVVSSGVDTPGLEPECADPEFYTLYESAPLVLAKGMGNYECLEGVPHSNRFFLFKVKCEVVASSVGKSLGDIVLKHA